jgi:hypothetical protein
LLLVSLFTFLYLTPFGSAVGLNPLLIAGFIINESLVSFGRR